MRRIGFVGVAFVNGVLAHRMSRAAICQLLQVVSFVLILAMPGRAQITEVKNTTSTPVPGSGHSYLGFLNETTNPANGSVSLRIQLPVPSGRGISLPFSIAYDSNGAHIITRDNQGWNVNDGVMDRGSRAGGGWSYSLPRISYVSTVATPGCTYDYYSNYVFYDPSGGRHNLYLADQIRLDPSNIGCNDGGLPPVLAGGDEFYLADWSNGQFVRSLDGSTYEFGSATGTPWGFGALANGITDRNGNQITIQNTGGGTGGFAVQDTLQRTAVSASGFGNNGDTISVAGLSQPYTLSWGSAPSNFSVSGNQLYMSPGGSCAPALPVSYSSVLPVVTTVTLPDGNRYQFFYDATYGVLQQIIYPTGAWIKYTWKINLLTDLIHYSDPGVVNPPNPPGPPTACWYSHDWYAVATREVSVDGANVALHQDFNYSTTWNPSNFQSWTGKQTTVTTHDLVTGQISVATYTYSAGGIMEDDPITGANSFSPMPLENTVTYQPSGGPVLKTVTQQWATSSLLASTQVTLDNGLTSKTNYSYATNPSSEATGTFVSLETEVDEYGFGTNAPGALLRQTKTTYVSFPGGTILDRPASLTVYDGSGNTMAATVNCYDQSTPAGTSGVVQHGGAGLGNLTQQLHWLNPPGGSNPLPTCQTGASSSALSTTFTYDDTGQVLSSTDPNGNPTQYSYTDSFTEGTAPGTTNAYVTMITRPKTGNVNHIEKFSYAYSDGQLTKHTDENGQSTSYLRSDVLRRLTEVDLPDTGKTTYNYHNDSLPLTVTRTVLATPDPSIITSTVYDGLGRVATTSVDSDPEGVSQVDFTYDGLGHKLTESNPHRVATATDSTTDGTTIYTYDALGRLTQATKQDGSVSTVSYTGNCTTATDEAGKQRKSCIDGLGSLIEVDEPNPGATATHATGWLTILGSEQTTNGTLTITVPGSGFETPSVGSGGSAYQYDPTGSSWTFTGGAGLTGNNSGFTSNQVAPEGQQVAFLQAAGGSISQSLSGFQAGASYTVSFQAAQRGNVSNGGQDFDVYLDSTLLATFKPAGTNYAVLSTPAFTTAAGAHTLKFVGRNSAGGDNTAFIDAVQVTGTTVAADTGTVSIGGTYTVNYGAGDTPSSIATRLAAAITAGGYANAVASGATINITSTIAGPAGDYPLSASYTWNSSQFTNPSFTTSVSGPNMTGGYNASDLNNNPLITLYTYDTLGNLLCVEQHGDGSGTGCSASPTSDASSAWRVRRFAYDSLSRLLTAHNPESGTITYSYDADGNVLQKTSPAPNQTGTATQTISYCYDALNRVTGKAYSAQTCTNGQLPAGTAVVSYVYDQGANAIGKLSSFADQAGSGSYVYDVLGRIASEQRTIAGVTKNLSYTYNLDSSVATVKYPSGAVITYTPDSAGRMLSAADLGNNINYATGATYGPDGALTGFLSGHTGSFNGITNSFSFNKRLQPINMSAVSPTATVFSINYDFHVGNGTSGTDNGNVWGITNNRDNTRNQTFTYDALNRLTSAQNAGTDCSIKVLNPATATKFWGNSYSYDAWGNLLGKSQTKCSAEHLSITADTNNHIHSLSGPDYTYDAAGNMTYDVTDGVTATYDAENRISAATKNSATATYTYDDDGNRVVKTNGSTGTLYWYMTPGIVGESDLAGNLKTEYVFFDGERVARRDFPSGNVSYYFSDHLKTASVVTDASGTILDESDYYPWGGELQFVNNLDNHYKFTGKERDSETGLDYFGARYYSNGLGRFISADWSATPIPVPYADFGDPQSLNQYSYVRNIPTVKVDADGHGVCPPDCDVEPEVDMEKVKETLRQLESEAPEAPAGASLLPAVGVGIALGAEAYTGIKIWAMNTQSDATNQLVHESNLNQQQIAKNKQQLGQARGADEDKSQSDDAKDKARTNGGLVKDQPATGPGTVPPDQRDPKRLWTKAERQAKLDQQGGKCARCGKKKTVDETQSHHKKRHANGGKTDDANHAAVCKNDCHKELHRD
ncbi:MAG TPA: RHS repeat-associated core domain-containing protein [Verrucomicrobiae bacterium]|jgi:RHS repeat-associated protein|nr:RHS repeat-associated core domain-containing protein [Verrucomicrobiae bacterium]